MKIANYFDLIVVIFLLGLCFAGFVEAASVICVLVTAAQIMVAALTGKQKNEGPN